MPHFDLTAGKEIDGKCTRCKRVTNHTIVAMVGATPKRVKCNTCGSEHRYIPAPEEPAAERRSRVRVVRDEGGRKQVSMGGGTSRTPLGSGRAPSGTRREPARRGKPSHAEVYFELCGNKERGGPRFYDASETFAEDELIRHPTFGEGLITKVRGRKLEVHFQEAGPKILVHTPEPTA